MNRKHLVPILIAAGAALPGIAVRLAGVELSPPLMAIVSGAAILGASFLLLWACDAAQADISQALALAVVALIAVLPEYAVDMYFTWHAGQNPQGQYVHYAVANMTGANRLLIGVGWGAIAAIFWWRRRSDVRIGKERTIELMFLTLATIYAFAIPIKGTLAWYDGLVFLGIYVAYIAQASRRPCTECEAEGPAEMLIQLPARQRRTATALLFLFAAGAIVLNAKPFCEGLVGTGKQLHVSEFFLVQWLAPIASEAPEFTVALMFAWRGRGGLALGSLLSSKLNQWTLLVGMIPGVFALSHGSLAHPMPLDHSQMNEILLTAAQSLLAVVLLAPLRLGLSGAFLLFALFISQLVAPSLVAAYPKIAFGMKPSDMHLFYSALYFTAAVAVFLQQPRWLLRLWKPEKEALADEATVEPEPQSGGEEGMEEEYRTPHCRSCQWRRAAEEAEAQASAR